MEAFPLRLGLAPFTHRLWIHQEPLVLGSPPHIPNHHTAVLMAPVPAPVCGVGEGQPLPLPPSQLLEGSRMAFQWKWSECIVNNDLPQLPEWWVKSLRCHFGKESRQSIWVVEKQAAQATVALLWKCLAWVLSAYWDQLPKQISSVKMSDWFFFPWM